MGRALYKSGFLDFVGLLGEGAVSTSLVVPRAGAVGTYLAGPQGGVLAATAGGAVACSSGIVLTAKSGYNPLSDGQGAE